MIDRTFNQYHITRKLGEGGMGVVYEAQDTTLRRRVALKFLAGPPAGHTAARDRLLREAQSAARLDHPGICTVYEIGEAQGQAFIAMAFIEGRTLTEVLEGGPLDLAEVRLLATKIQAALEHAHTAGVVHRDLKPGNIMITSQGEPVLMDFGLARIGDRTRLTQEGTTLGTPRYMSPEQAQGIEAGPATDIWSLGVIVYEMLAGCPPFQGEHPQAILYAISHVEPPPIKEVRAGVPADLADLITGCLNKDPGERDLAILNWSPTAGKIPGKARRSRILAYLSVAVILVVLAVGVWGKGWFRGATLKPREVNPLIAVMPFTYRGNPEFDYLGEGMMDLLVTNLDGVAGARTIDPASLAGAIHRLGGEYRRDLAPEVARELGCSRFLTGTVTEAGGNLRVLAHLVTLEDEETPVRAEAEGSLGALFYLVDQLSSQLLVQAEDSPVEAFELAALTQTTDLEVLKAYLEGEKKYRELNFESHDFSGPISAFQRAVDLDSTFALGWYGLAKVHTFDHSSYSEKTRNLVSKANSLSDGLPTRARRTLESLHAVIVEGDFDKAERLDRQTLSEYPQDLTALLSLIKTLFVSDSLRARDWHEVLPLCEQYNSLCPWKLGDGSEDPGDTGWTTRFYLGMAAVEQGDWARMDELGYEEDVPFLHLNTQRAFLQSDEENIQDVLKRLDDDIDFWIIVSGAFLIVPDFQPDAVFQVISLLTEPHRSRLGRAQGHLSLSLLEAGRGRLQSARNHLAELQALHPDPELVYRGWLSGQDFFPVTKEELAELVRNLEAWKAVEPWTSSGGDEDGYHQLRRLYTMGLLSVKLGDYPKVLLLAAQLDTLTTEKDTGSAATDLALGLKARVARAEGHPQEALAILESIQRHIPFGLHWHNPFLNQPSERLLRGDLLLELERPQESIRWYGSLKFEGFSFFNAQGELGLARANAELGRFQEATVHLDKYSEIMTGCDEEFRGYIAAAEKLAATFPP